MATRSSATDPYAAALRLLARRGYSEAELTARLLDKGHAAERVAAALARCRELGYLDDARYAETRARTLLGSGRAAGRRLLADLARRGVAGETAQRALQVAEREYPAAERLRLLVARRYPHFDFAAAPDTERRRVVSFFLRRGFELSLVLSILKDERPEG